MTQRLHVSLPIKPILLGLGVALVAVACGGSGDPSDDSSITGADSNEGTEIDLADLSFSETSDADRAAALHSCFCDLTSVADMPLVKGSSNDVAATWATDDGRSYNLETETFDLPDVQGLRFQTNYTFNNDAGKPVTLSATYNERLIRFGDFLQISIHEDGSEQSLTSVGSSSRYSFSLPDQELRDPNDRQGTNVEPEQSGDLWDMFQEIRSSRESAAKVAASQLDELEALGADRLASGVLEKCVSRQEYAGDGIEPECTQWDPLDDADTELLRSELATEIEQARTNLDQYGDLLHQGLIEALPEDCFIGE